MPQVVLSTPSSPLPSAGTPLVGASSDVGPLRGSIGCLFCLRGLEAVDPQAQPTGWRPLDKGRRHELLESGAMTATAAAAPLVRLRQERFPDAEPSSLCLAVNEARAGSIAVMCTSCRIALDTGLPLIQQLRTERGAWPLNGASMFISGCFEVIFSHLAPIRLLIRL